MGLKTIFLGAFDFDQILSGQAHHFGLDHAPRPPFSPS
jgi:hypothetical protein